MRTTVQFDGTQTDLYSGVAEDSSTLVPPASKLILDASGVPVVIDLWVESIDYRDAELELSRREEAIPEPDDLPPGPFSPDDPRIAAVDWISVDENGYLVVEGKAGWGDDPADIALLDRTPRGGPDEQISYSG